MLRFFVAYLLIISAVNTLAETNSASSSCASKTTLSFGMVPLVSSNLSKVWASKINQQIPKGACFELSFSSAINLKHYIDKAKQGDFDVLAAPAHIASYLIANANFKPVAFLVWESNYLYVVPNNSNISAIDQFEGSTLALPDSLAEASILAQKEILANHSDVNFQYYQNYNQIISALLNGESDAGVILSPFYNGYKKHMDLKLKIIHTSPFPSHGMLIAAPHTSEYDQTELFKTLATLDSNSGLFWQSFEAVSQQEIEKLHLDQAATVETLKLLVSKD